MEQIRAILLKTSAILIIGLLLLGCIPFTALGGGRTGTTGNEPAVGFSEGTEKVEIYHQDLSHNTNFNIGDTVYIRITTSQISTLSGTNNNNVVRIYNYLGAQVGSDYKPFFSKVGTGGPPYVYEGSFVASNGNGFTISDNYKLYLTLRSQNGNARVNFYEVIHVGAANPEEKSIRLYSDAAYTTETYQFSPTAKMYVSVWAGNNNADAPSSDTVLRTYPGLTVQKQVVQLANPTLTKNGNYTRFIYDLSADPGVTITFVNKCWYTLSVTLNDGNSDLIRDWSVQFGINFSLANPPVLAQGTTTATPNSITVGLESTTISTPFTHSDKPSPDLFKVTYNVRHLPNAEIHLVNNATNGFGGLTVVQDAVDKTKYTAIFVWAPNAQTPVGLYDLYFYVNDTVNKAEDAYVNNLAKLELKPPPAVPIIVAGSTKATPNVIQAPGAYTTVFSFNFTDTDGPAADSFKVTLRVRDPGNTILSDLVPNLQSGSGGLLVIKTTSTAYTANFTWNPADTAVIGPYDLYSRVEDTNGAFAEDYFGSNLDKLVLTKPSALPIVTAGATKVQPDHINRTGTETTVISTDFHDDDLPSITTFTVIFMVRDEANKTYTLVNDMHHGYGGLNIMDLGTGNYKASYSWDPSDTQPLGKYDLYFKVTTANFQSATDDYVSNPDELTITKKPSPPVMGAGATTATPSIVNVEEGTTTLKTTFTHPDIPAVTTFKLTFKVRDIGNQEYVLVSSGTSGSPATLTVTGDNKGNYTAQFVWDPPSVGQPLGSYALYSAVEDLNAQKVQDPFSNNLDKLTLIRATPPQGDGNLTGFVKDQKGKPIVNATVKVYNSTSHVVVQTLTTKADGSYKVQVHSGPYDVGVEADRYKGEVQSNLQVKKGDLLTVPDFKLIKTTGNTGNAPNIPSYIFGLIVLLVVIIVILCLFLALKMGKGSGEGMAPRGPVHRHEMRDEDIESDHPLEPKEEREMATAPKPIPKERIRIEKLKEDKEE